jgi:hypothetical protein
MSIAIPPTYTANDIIIILVKNISNSLDLAALHYREDRKNFKHLIQETIVPSKILANLIEAQDKDQQVRDKVLLQSKRELEEELKNRLCSTQMPCSGKESDVVSTRLM